MFQSHTGISVNADLHVKIQMKIEICNFTLIFAFHVISDVLSHFLLSPAQAQTVGGSNQWPHVARSADLATCSPMSQKHCEQHVDRESRRRACL